MRWTAVVVLVLLVVVRYGVPYFTAGSEPPVITGEADDDLKDRLTPPTQTFTDPIARQLVGLGKDLVANPRERQDAIRQLFILSENPEALGEDMTAYLAISSAYWQLRRDPEVRGSLETAMLLWDAAERIERNSAIAAASREDGLR